MKHQMIFAIALSLLFGSSAPAGTGSGGGVMDALNTRSAVLFRYASDDCLAFDLVSIKASQLNVQSICLPKMRAKNLHRAIKKALLSSKERANWALIER